MYAWKCHKETPCVATLNKQKCLFSKLEDRKVKQVLSGGVVPVGGGGHKERMEEGDCGEKSMYSCTKMEKLDLLKLFQELGEEGKGE
jgi:hypothetical protein